MIFSRIKFIQKLLLPVEIYGNPEVISGGIITGGVLCDKVYRFHKLRIWISQDPNGRSYNEIDGKG